MKANVDFEWQAKELLLSMHIPITNIRVSRVSNKLKKMYEFGYKDCIKNNEIARILEPYFGTGETL